MKDKFKRPYVRKAKAQAKSLTKTQKAEVKKLVAAPVETKYVAQIATVNGGGLPAVDAQAFGVLTTIVSGGPLFAAWQLLPGLQQGTDGHQRMGNKICDVTLKSTWQFYINPNIAQYPTVDATVKVFILKSKTAKNFAALQSVPAGSLLDFGDATSRDWLPASPIEAKTLDMFPVNKEQFSVLKIHKFRICKNFDSPSGGTATGSAPNMISHQTKDFTHTLKHKSTVVYPDNNLGSVQPNNLSYFAYVVAWDTNTFATLPANTILCNARAHMYYKDA